MPKTEVEGIRPYHPRRHRIASACTDRTRHVDEAQPETATDVAHWIDKIFESWWMRRELTSLVTSVHSQKSTIREGFVAGVWTILEIQASRHDGAVD